MSASRTIDWQGAVRDLRRERRRASPERLAAAHAALSALSNATRARRDGDEPERRERPSLPQAAE